MRFDDSLGRFPELPPSKIHFILFPISGKELRFCLEIILPGPTITLRVNGVPGEHKFIFGTLLSRRHLRERRRSFIRPFVQI